MRQAEVILSSGVMWTTEVKSGLLRHNPELFLVDGFSSSEAIGLGSSIMTRSQTIEVASFTLGPSCQVFTEDHQRVEPGSEESGMVAVTGFLPVGYYKDAQKTAATFPVIDGVRYSIPGDWVRVEADGKITGNILDAISVLKGMQYKSDSSIFLEMALRALAVGLP